MAGEDCSALFAIFPIFFILIFISILSKALRGTGGYYGGYSRGASSYRRPGMYYALQYLDNRGGYGQSYNSGYGYQQPRYSSYNPPQQVYQERPPAGISPSFGSAPPPAYSPGYAGYQPAPPPAYSTGAGGFASAPAYPSSYAPAPAGPAPEVPKATCSYCGSLSPATERHCMLCGAPMK